MRSWTNLANFARKYLYHAIRIHEGNNPIRNIRDCISKFYYDSQAARGGKFIISNAGGMIKYFELSDRFIIRRYFIVVDDLKRGTVRDKNCVVLQTEAWATASYLIL